MTYPRPPWVFLAGRGLSLAAVSGEYSLVVVSGGSSPAAVHSLLIALLLFEAPCTHGLSSWGARAELPRGTRDQVDVPGIASWILNHWTPRDVRGLSFKMVADRQCPLPSDFCER